MVAWVTDDVSSTIDILLVSGPSQVPLSTLSAKWEIQCCISAIGNQKIIVYSFFRENK